MTPYVETEKLAATRRVTSRGTPLFPDEPQTLSELFIQAATKHDRPDALSYKRGGEWQHISSKNLLALTLSLSLKPLVRSFPDIAFSIFAGVAVINCLVRVHMKIEINRRASPRDRISWLAFDTKSEIVRKYRHLEPESALPSISRVTWWLCAVSFAGLISTIFLDR